MTYGRKSLLWLLDQREIPSWQGKARQQVAGAGIEKVTFSAASPKQRENQK